MEITVLRSTRGKAAVGVFALVLAGTAALVIARRGGDASSTAGEETAVAAANRPALTVATVLPQQSEWPRTVSANGNIVAWQEAIIGAELAGLRLTEVLVDVGDTVKRGQPLARLAADVVAAELAQARASVAEAEASLAEAKANAERSRQLQAQGFISKQATIQLFTAEQTAQARLAAARARAQAEDVRLALTRILSPDDGVISARTATVGSLTQPGEELFRLIRGGRLEWRAEVTASELARLQPDMAASITTPSGERISGRVRAVAPAVDPTTRNGIVYVDIAAGGSARAGTFARGEFELGSSPALTVPQSAVLLRDGFAYVFQVGPDNKVAQLKVELGRRVGDRIEVRTGLDATTRVVETGAGFLADGDTVRVVAESTAPMGSATK